MKLDEERVRGTRERLGLTLAMVAQRAGTSKNTVLSAEHGGDIRPTTARKIAEALEVEIADLVGEQAQGLGVEVADLFEADYPKARAQAEPGQPLTAGTSIELQWRVLANFEEAARNIFEAVRTPEERRAVAEEMKRSIDRFARAS